MIAYIVTACSEYAADEVVMADSLRDDAAGLTAALLDDGLSVLVRYLPGGPHELDPRVIEFRAAGVVVGRARV